MSKKLHNFDLKGLHWSTFGRPRGSGHSSNEATSGDSSAFIFRADRETETSASKLADSLRDLRIPRGKVLEPRFAKGKQVMNDDVVEGAQLLTNGREKNSSVRAEEDSDDVALTKLSGTAVQIDADGGRKWNLRNRKRAGLSMGAVDSNRSVGSSSAGGPIKGKGKEPRDSCNGEREMPQLPTFSLSVTKEEAMEDLAKMLGKPPPKKLKKRPRKIQRHIDLLFPGGNLEGITLERYEVHEKAPARKGK